MPDSDFHGDRQQRVKGRVVVMDAFDEVMLTFALRDAFPEVEIREEVERVRVPGQLRLESRYRQVETIADCELTTVAHMTVFYDPTGGGDRSHDNRATAGGRRDQWFQFNRSHWVYSGRGSERWAFKPPTLIEGSLCTSYYPDDRAAKRVVDKVWRILEKITTNLPRYEIDEQGRRRKQRVLGPDVWYGHHALEWCRSDPKRMLNGNALPTPDWELPDTEWFRALYDRVVAAYGPDFGKPEPPEPGPSPGIGFRLG